MTEIIKADKGRRNLLIGIAAVTILILAGIVFWGLPWFQNYLEKLVEGNRIAELRNSLLIMEACMVAFLLGFIVFGIWFIRIGKRAQNERRFPPNGVKVIRDTPVQLDDTAVTKGKLIAGLGFFLIITSIMANVVVVMLFQYMFKIIE